ncbi:hypothetical protein BU25DRAFT_420380 [Macroventuria anomochaeta]|uniref:Uncharacterized protein n=2 Tax=Macroventuria anomochaeta TaxID=301207 RepID=A0ACB6RKB4_9PLEO|nr:uncharacterized protein BU25DRAFT_426119 [Macroventuria anomochaeta]XP_033563133.1 uncharacterized protein BU25DRAFT_420380 [Macroventuria anomochaeta]KAF2621850.1 hypothetical protein BU25DRAFT_426119 [Macroventuria anomochaeta]KAF2628942.1 hypothetical protein BU25DRAFT_420380 [Macroventuria anomochaeta]
MRTVHESRQHLNPSTDSKLGRHRASSELRSLFHGQGFGTQLYQNLTVSITAGQGNGSPAKEFFLPLFANCSDAEMRRPGHFSPGTLVIYPACSEANQIAGVISAENAVPEIASSFIATGITDQLGFTGNEQASNLVKLFPLALVRCVVLTQDVIKTFNSSSAMIMSGSGAAVPISSIFCGQ